LSIKTGALPEKQKGRDFYGISSSAELYQLILDRCSSVDSEKKSKDFEKLVFDQAETKKVRLFPEYIKQKIHGSVI
jgi:hypothetical protein